MSCVLECVVCVGRSVSCVLGGEVCVMCAGVGRSVSCVLEWGGSIWLCVGFAKEVCVLGSHTRCE